MSEVDPLWTAFLEIAAISEYRNKWIHELKWLELLKIRHPELADITDEYFCRVVRKEARKVNADNFERKNTVGIFMIEYSFKTDPITKKRRMHSHYFYAMNKKKYPKRPEEKTGTPFAKRHNQDLIPLDAAKPKPKPQTRKRAASPPPSPPTRVSPRKHQKVVEQLGPEVTNYWFSKEANNQFVKDDNFKGDASVVLQKFREDLLDAIGNHNYTDVVVGLNAKNQDSLSEKDRTNLMETCCFVATAFLHALEWMPKGEEGKNWNWCCGKACEDVNRMGHKKTRSAKQVRKWSKMFICNGGKFPHPNPEKLKPRQYVPECWELCPESKDLVVDYATKNLANLTAEALRTEFKDKILPKCIEDYSNESNTDFLQNLQENIPCGETFRKWLTDGLGWKQDKKKKSFYVDGHESPAQRAARKAFVIRYLNEFEPNMYRYVQLTEEEVDAAIGDNKLPKHFKTFGKKYEEEDGTSWIEFHVDDHDWLFNYSGEKHKEFGAALSWFARIEKGLGRDIKPLILWGHDECSFSQYLMRVNQWVTDKGQRAIDPKGEGENYMVSAFTCREFGFALELSPEELELVNKHRAGQHYKATRAAKEVDEHGKTDKPMLESTPFIRFFESGSKYEGYWNNRHMMIQIEDCMDVLDSVPRFKEFRHKFMFDSSTGHTAKQEGGLSSQHMIKGWGGHTQPRNFHSVELKDESYLGEHINKIPEDERIIVPCMYHYNFKEGDNGPVLMKKSKRQENKYDAEIPNAEPRAKSARTLKMELLEADVGLKEAQLSNGPLSSAPAVIKLAQQHGIPLTTATIREGWVDSPKGMWQILWERGFIDPENKSKYTLKNDDPKYSLKDLMNELREFREEKTFIQHICEDYGYEAIYTPKYHAEIAGCGIEYIWGAAKARYRSFGIEKKTGREKFKNSVKEALQVIKMSTARKCDRKARTYIKAYHTLEVLMLNPDGSERKDGDEILLEDIKKLVKRYRTHRSALDFDYKFIQDLLKDD
jgi:hypothetical protein